MPVLLPSKPRGLANNIGSGSGSGSGSNNVTNLSVGDSLVSVMDDNTPLTNISLITNSKIGIYVNDTQRIGINFNAPTKRLVINDELGETIRLIYNSSNQNKFADINIDSNGSLVFKTYNNQYVNFIDSTNTSTPNIKFNNQTLLATAEQLNYNSINTSGIAEANKAVILDQNRSITNINTMRLNELTVDDLYLNDELRINVDTSQYGLQISNNTGNCLKLQNNNHFTLFNIQSTGVLSIYNNANIIEILSDKNNNLIYPIQLTTENNLNNTGIGIKFNTYNNDNIKRNMSSIETIITNNQNNNENSIIKFNNMNNGNLTNTVTIRNDGYILCNTLMELSDRRTKYILSNSNFEESLEKISKINTYNFMYKNDSKKIIHKGLIAQELYDIIPSAIHIEHTNDLHDLYTISNKELIGYLIDCIKALKYKIENFKMY
jgi:hypothetical protein